MQCSKKHDVFHFFHIIIVFPNLDASSETVPLTHLHTYGDIILYMILNLLQNTQSFRYTNFFLKVTPGKPMFFQLPTFLRPPDPATSCCWEAMRVVKCFSLEPMALEMLNDARERELEAQWFKRKEPGAVFMFEHVGERGGW